MRKITAGQNPLLRFQGIIMKISTGIATVLLGTVTFVLCAQAQDQRRVTIMSYNVETLFDTEDNPAREGDNTYLPLSLKDTPEHEALCKRNNDTPARVRECMTLDWNEQVLARKL